MHAPAAGSLPIDAEVQLTHLKLEQTFAGSVALDPETGEVIAIFSGTGTRHDPDQTPLS